MKSIDYIFWITLVFVGIICIMPNDKITNQEAMKVLDPYFIDVVCPNCEGSGEVIPPPYYTEEYRKTHKFKCPMCTEMGNGKPGMITIFAKAAVK